MALVGVTAARAIFWTIPTRFLTGVAAAGGLAFINSIGTVGGFVGPSMMGWLKEFSGSYVFGLSRGGGHHGRRDGRVDVAEAGDVEGVIRRAMRGGSTAVHVASETGSPLDHTVSCLRRSRA